MIRNINEANKFNKISQKTVKKKNLSLPSKNKLKTTTHQDILPKNITNNKRNIINNISSKSIRNNDHQLKYDSLNNLAYKIISENKNLKLNFSEQILLELFINISEFNESCFDFFVPYSNLINILKSKGLLDNEIYNKIILTKNDLDIILKQILTNKNSSKKLNFKNFLRFLSYLAYKIDPLHFIDKPKRTLNFIITKYFYNYNKKNNNSFIRFIYSYILTIQEEKDINIFLNDIIYFLGQIYIKYFQNEDNSENFINDKENCKCIVQAMKYLGIYPILINIKELVIMYYILLDDNNSNKYLDIQDININNTFKFHKFCQFFLTLCLFIKEKNHILLNQYSNLLNKKNDIYNFDNILKNGQKEGIIKFILNLNIINKYKNKNIYPNNFNLNKQNINTDIIDLSNEFNLNDEEINYIKQIFESYSSHYDKNLNNQICFSDIINFLKDCNLLLLNNNQSNLLIDKISKAQINSRNNIKKLKKSLHSLDHLFNSTKIKKVKYSYDNSNSNNNQISLGDLEIIFAKVKKKEKININKSVDNILLNKNYNKEYNLNNQLNLKNFIYFLFLLSNNFSFESFSQFIQYLLNQNNNIHILNSRNRNINLKYLFEKYNEINSSELINLIQEFSPIINLYFISYKRNFNHNNLTFSFNDFFKIFSEFEIFPKLINYNFLQSIFYLLYQINTNSEEEIVVKEENIKDNIIEKNKEINFNDFMYSFGIISFYLKDLSQINEMQGFLAIFYLIINSDKIKPYLKDMNINFIEIIKEKMNDVIKKYNILREEEEPEFIRYLKDPYL